MMTVETKDLGLRDWHSNFPVTDLDRLRAPADHVMPSGALPLHAETMTALMEYSSSLPTGQRPGKVWKRLLGASGEWWLGRYGDPYPEGHEHHGSIPIQWFRIHVMGTPASWPREITVPPPARPGPVAAPLGGADGEEGSHCLRDDGRGGFCLNRIEYVPNSDLGGCNCASMRMPPCSYCVSTMPECRGCGWRMED